MSEIKVDTLTGKTTAKTVTVTVGATATQSLEQGLAKAWVYFDTNDSPPVRDGSFNVSSLTDNNTEIEVNLTPVMADLFYCPLGTAGQEADNPSNRNISTGIVSTTKVDTEVYNMQNSQVTAICYVAVLGGVA